MKSPSVLLSLILVGTATRHQLAEAGSRSDVFILSGMFRPMPSREDGVVPLHSDFDRLSPRWLQGGQESSIDSDGDTPRHPCAA